MLSIQKLELFNFITYKHAIFDFEELFKKDRLLLITGENLDLPNVCSSNGAGKSLVYEAFCWAVFGRTTRGGLKDGVIGASDTGCHVVVEIKCSVTGNEYKIVRYRKHENHGNNVYFYINKKRQNFTIASDVDKVIWQTLGVSYNKCLNTCIFKSDDERRRFVYMTDIGRKQLMSEMRGTDIFFLCEKIANQEFKNIEVERQEVETILQNLMNTKSRLTQELKSLNISSLKFAKESDAKLENLRRQRLDAKATAYAEKKAIKDKLNKKEKQIAILKLQNDNKSILSYEEKIKNYREKITVLNKEMAVQNFNIKNNSAIINNAYNIAAAGTLCERCGGVIKGENLKAHTNTLQVANKAAKCACGGLSEAILAYNGKLNLADKKLLTHLDRKRKKAVFLEGCIQLKKQLKSIEDGYKNFMVEFDKRIVELENALCPYGVLMQTNIENIRQLYHEIAKYRCKITAIKERCRYYSIWKAGYGKEELQHEALLCTVEQFNKNIQKYSSRLSDDCLDIRLSTEKIINGKKIRNLMDFDITDISKERSLPFKEFSTGEKKRIEIICNFAFIDLDENIFSEIFLDELFDGLDAAGMGRVIKLLKQKTEEGRNICVITHLQEVADYFDNHLDIVKKGGISEKKADGCR